MMTTADRVMILGLDGATWTVLDPMRARGVMPNLDALLERSAHGTLRSTIPPVTTAAWTTMMTGCDPSRHGVFDHRYYDAAERPDEGQPLGPRPGAERLADALRRRPIGRRPEPAGQLSRRRR